MQLKLPIPDRELVLDRDGLAGDGSVRIGRLEVPARLGDLVAVPADFLDQPGNQRGEAQEKQATDQPGRHRLESP